MFLSRVDLIMPDVAISSSACGVMADKQAPLFNKDDSNVQDFLQDCSFAFHGAAIRVRIAFNGKDAG
ncbi:hypothetical protein RYA05_11275 [Pseudomonas syringae pv. actinidiae]|uniref:Uncharacterized protein n=5 Tax=Pseudomonas syringae group TaxID=136849 RepID=A0A2G7MFQ8_PSESF|nr:hypothetical protein [Pseudomonas syringae]EPN61414.1 hypothetical protein A235_22181 [Pseudomonas syringae pv. actinidiae ICMP 19079]OZI86043.1 hypothetical protein CFN58_14335 [Pseudomonas avellanae]AKT29956.1 hypothetical protein IYO_010540 [Pseudomonas syringae pv. actinidiae ICMP 18884]AOE56404.1 hypothetical protein NZ708_10520 [Pseudomonas syringae pv. actinidiae ICMP 18708]APP97366.1 hypothetical protein PsaNZ45_11075 [Pseudomonas syringae pv. actinidiae]